MLSLVDSLSRIYGRFLAALSLLGCAILMAMMLVIVADVFLRNVVLPGMPRGLAWSTEVSELMLYLITMCVAPWLLRQGQHIRVDIVLQAIPARLAGRCDRFCLLRGDRLLRHAGGLVKFSVRCGQHQNTRHARVVGAGPVAFCICAAVG
jgi:hypothetical protein